MSIYQLTVLCAVVLSALLAVTSALDCYVCGYSSLASSIGFSSSENEACKDPFTGATISPTTCSGADYCYKTKGTAGDIETIIRGCGYDGVFSADLGSFNFEANVDKCETNEVGDLRSDVCACTTDNCNGASTLIPRTGTFLALLTALVMAACRLF